VAREICATEFPWRKSSWIWPQSCADASDGSIPKAAHSIPITRERAFIDSSYDLVKRPESTRVALDLRNR